MKGLKPARSGPHHAPTHRSSQTSAAQNMVWTTQKNGLTFRGDEQPRKDGFARLLNAGRLATAVIYLYVAVRFALFAIQSRIGPAPPGKPTSRSTSLPSWKRPRVGIPDTP